MGEWSALKATLEIAAFDPVPTVKFGPIERTIGFRQQNIQIAGMAVRRCDANAHRHCERATCSGMRSGLECLANSVRDPRGFLVRVAGPCTTLNKLVALLEESPSVRNTGERVSQRSLPVPNEDPLLHDTSEQQSAEETVRDIRRATRRHFSAEEKIRIVLEGLRGEDSVAELCRKEGIAQNLYYRWSKEFLEAGKKRLAGDTAREASSDEVKQLRAEARQLKEALAEATLENRLLKKSVIADGEDIA